MVGEKIIKALEEFQQGKTIMEILFSSNPGIIRDRIEPIRDRIQLPERREILTKPEPVKKEIPPKRGTVAEKISAVIPALRPVAIKKLPPVKKPTELYYYGR